MPRSRQGAGKKGAGELQLKVFLAGRIAVEADAVVIDEGRFPGRQGRLLFAYLVAEHGRPVPRDELAEALWGESPPATWEKALTVVVSKLRGLVTDIGLDGSTVLTGAFGCYRLELPEGSWVDVIVAANAAQEAEGALAAGDLEEARDAATLAESLVRHPFMPGEEGTWVEEQRRALADVRGRALATLTDACLQSGDASAAVKWAEQTIALAPFRETGYRRLMEGHIAAGNRAEALRVYEQCRRLLAEELGSYPSPETESIYRDLLEAPAPTSVAVAAETPALDVAPVANAERRSKSRVVGLASRKRVAVVTLTVAVTAAAAVGSLATRSPGKAQAAAAANSVAAIDTGSNRLVADVPVGNGPTSVAAGEGSVWVANSLDGTVSRVDPATGGVVQRIDVGDDPGGIAVGHDAVWVANSRDATVSRIDPQTNREVQAIPVGVTPTALAVDGATVWVTSAEERSVSRIDAVHGRVVDRIPTGALGRGIAVGGGSVWVTDESSRSVVRIDSRSGRVVQTVSVGNGPTGIAFGDDAVWVANSLDGTVSRIDATAGRVTATILVGEGPDGIAVGSGDVWVTGEFSEEISRIDSAENRVAERIPIANRPKGIALWEDRVWLAVQASGAESSRRATRRRRERVDSGTHRPELQELGRDDLLAQRRLRRPRRPSAARRQRGRPDRAEPRGSAADGDRRRNAVPLPTAARYPLLGWVAREGERLPARVRAGDPRGSNRARMAASARRRRAHARGGRGAAISARAFEPTMPPARSSSNCGGLRTSSCGISRFLPPIPAGTPDRDQGVRPVPSTGPYMIESYVPDRVLRLVRNPYFRVWSRSARPDGFPDEIVFRLNRAFETSVSAVERGRVDVGAVSLEHTESILALEDFKARYPSQYRIYQEPATVLAFLNTTQPPFDDVRVRQAVNYAVDRAAVSGSYAPGFAEPTCQLRPPGTVGFRRYCPYTAAPSDTGEWRAPDLARARRLVAASGTRGMTVMVWTYPGFWEAGARGAVRALESLGYRATIRRAENLDTYIAKVTDQKTRGVQAGMIGWYGVPRTADSLLTLLRCNPPDFSFFCDRRLDTRIDRALKMQAHDPDAVVATWARIERDIVDLAPWVPLFTPAHIALFSERVGNHQYSPEWRLLYDQLWVR